MTAVPLPLDHSWNPDILDFMKRITVDIPEDLYERLRLAAYTEHRSVSEVVRDRLTTSLPELPSGSGDEA